MVFKVALLVMLCICKDTDSAHILLPWTTTYSSPSVTMVLSAITKSLLSRGHNVTLLTDTNRETNGFPLESFSNIIKYKATYDQKELVELMLNFTKLNQEPPAISKLWNLVQSVWHFKNMMVHSCRDLFNDKIVLHELNTIRFDLVLIFPFCACDVLLPSYVNAPFIVAMPTVRLPLMSEGVIGMPYPTAYVPLSPTGYLTDEMTFLERIQNLVSSVIFAVLRHALTLPFEEIKSSQLIAPDKTFNELYSDSMLWLSHSGIGNDFPRPTTPNWIPIGGLMAGPGQPLPRELEDFVNASGESGIVLFSLGSAMKALFNNEVAETFAKVFSKLPQRIIWKHDGKIPTNLGNNTKIMKWIPQNDILAHSKTRAFIYHGGSSGVYEAVYHAVPMIIMPIRGDQMTHAARVRKKGMGIVIDMENLTEENLMQSLQEVLKNPNYKKNIQHFSAIHRDLFQTPKERAIYWIEHVIKFGGAHLRPPSADMGSIKLYMIDVMIFSVFVLSLGLYIDLLIIRKCYKRCANRKEDKRKKE